MKIRDLLEANYGEIQEKNIEDLAELAKKHCSEYLKRRKSGQLWRGVRKADLDAHSIDTATLERKSKSNRNYYTILMDASPNFAGYPKRSKSLICSTSFDTANYYSGLAAVPINKNKKIFEVIPFDDALVACCNEDDILTVDIDIFGRKRAFVELDSIFLTLGISDDSIESFKEFARKNVGNPAFSHMVNDDVTPETFMDYLYDCFDPEKLGMKKFTGATVSFSKKKEYWVQGKVLMIPAAKVEEFNQALGLKNEAV